MKGENSVKLFGNDLAPLEKTADKIKDVMSTVPGITDLAVFNSLGSADRADRHRPDAGRRATGSAPATSTRPSPPRSAARRPATSTKTAATATFRSSSGWRRATARASTAIRRITIGAPNPNGSGIVPIPLTDVADVKLVSGASFIYRENQERYIPIKFSVRGRDLGGAVLEAQRKIAREVRLPAGYRLEWVGEFGDLEDAIERLEIVVPMSLGLIGLLLFVNFGSLTDMLLAASVMPMALVGGIFALFLTGTPFSVSAAIGFVALFGISAMDGIIVLASYNQLIFDGMARAAAVRRACEVQMRPVVMTCVAACVGLLPAAVSTGIGSQVQKPLALVVVGGILLAPVLILIVLPVLIDMFSRRRQPVEAVQPQQPAPAE